VQQNDVASTAADAEITSFFNADPAVTAWPYPMYERWRSGNGVVRWEGGPATLLTHHSDVKAVMSGAMPVFSNGYRYGSMAQATISRLPVESHEIFFEILDWEGLFMSRKEGADHARLKKISSRAFTARRVEALRASIQWHVDDLLSTMVQSPTCDVKTQFANQLPVRVITDMIGIPQSDREMIWHWSEDIAAMYSVGEGTLARAKESVGAFREYVGAMINRLRETGEGPELAMLMLQGSAKDDALTEEELIAMYLLIIFGGSETTTNLLGNGFLALQRNRDQWDILREEPSLVRGAVDEILRYDTPHHYLPRVAATDFEVGGTAIPEGQTVIIVMGAANRDPQVFDDADMFDVRRSNKSDHLSLAFGAHFCLGAALARLEGEIAFATLTQRFPDAHLLTNDIAYGGSAMLRAIQSLPTDLGEDALIHAHRSN
jgi:cytochrome P450